MIFSHSYRLCPVLNLILVTYPHFWEKYIFCAWKYFSTWIIFCGANYRKLQRNQAVQPQARKRSQPVEGRNEFDAPSEQQNRQWHSQLVRPLTSCCATQTFGRPSLVLVRLGKIGDLEEAKSVPCLFICWRLVVCPVPFPRTWDSALHFFMLYCTLVACSALVQWKSLCQVLLVGVSWPS